MSARAMASARPRALDAAVDTRGARVFAALVAIMARCANTQRGHATIRACTTLERLATGEVVTIDALDALLRELDAEPRDFGQWSGVAAKYAIMSARAVVSYMSLVEPDEMVGRVYSQNISSWMESCVTFCGYALKCDADRGEQSSRSASREALVMPARVAKIGDSASADIETGGAS